MTRCWSDGAYLVRENWVLVSGSRSADEELKGCSSKRLDEEEGGEKVEESRRGLKVEGTRL